MIRSRACLVLVALLALTACTAAAVAEPVLETEDEKLLYALGLALSQRLGTFEFTPEELKTIQAGIRDGVLGNEARIDLEVYGPQLDPMMQKRASATAEREKAAGTAFCEKAATEPGAERTESGIVYREIKAGEGEQPSATDVVKLHYHGTLRDGKVFDSSVDKGEPAEFALNAVIQCFGEAVQRMKVGGKSKVVCPASAAYGDRGSPPLIRPGAAISFDIELLGITTPEPAPAAG